MTDATHCLFVVPMHRSGSSAFARVLNLLGASLPDRLLGATKANALGHWEPSDVVRVNDRILAAADLSWDSLLPFPPGWFDTSEALALEKPVTSALRRNYVGRPLWLLKDPRLSRTLPLWLKRLRPLAAQPVAVHPVRNPLEVAESLRARDGMDLARGLQLWLRYMLEGEANTRAVPRLFVPYDDLLADWRAVAGRVGEHLAVTWPVGPDAAAAEIGAFLSEGQRHHRIPLAGRTDVPPDVLAVYEAFRRLVREPSDASALSVLDEVRRRIDGDAAQAIAEDLRAERRRVRDREAEAAARLDTLAALAERCAAIVGHGSGSSGGEAAAGPPETAVPDAAARIEAALVTLSAGAAPVGSDDPVARAALTADRLAALTATLLRDGVIGAGGGKAADAAEVAGLEAELARIQTERTRAETLAGELQERVGALRAERDRVARERETARRERDQARRERDGLRREVDGLHLELERLWPERRRDAEERERLATDNRRLASAAEDLKAAADRSRTMTRAAVRLIEADWQVRAERARQTLRAAQAAWQPADGIRRTYGIALAARLDQPLAPLPPEAEQLRSAGLARPLPRPRGFARSRAARLAHRLAPVHFLPAFYAEQAGLSGLGRTALVEHYLTEGHRAGFDPSPLFSTRHYRDAHLGGDTSVPPLLHYLSTGVVAGLSPHPLFDAAFYAGQLPPAVRGAVDLLLHYDTIGWRSGLDPHPAFSTVHYLNRGRDVAGAGLSPLMHYLLHGHREGREPNPLFWPGFLRRTEGEGEAPLQVALARRAEPEGPDLGDPHPLFSVAHYRSVARHGRDAAPHPLEHFFRVGMDRLLSPSPAFDVDHYLVAVEGETGGLHPLIDLVAGRGSGDVAPHPAFDPAFYKAQRRLSEAFAGPPVADYLAKVPSRLTAAPHPLFDVDYYLRQHPELARRGLNPLLHYLARGWREGHSPRADFDPGFYRRELGLPPSIDPFVHYLRFGHDLDVPGSSGGRGAPTLGGRPALPVVRAAVPQESDGAHPFDPALGSVLVVAHVVGRERYGGERSFLDMLEGLTGVGLNIVAVLPRDEAEYTAAVRERSSKVVVLPYGWWRGDEAASHGVVSAFSGLIARYRAQVVHVNTVMLLEPLVAARRAGVRGVVHAREILVHDPALCERIGLSAGEIVAAVWSRSDVVIANSAACASAYAAALGPGAVVEGVAAAGGEGPVAAGSVASFSDTSASDTSSPDGSPSAPAVVAAVGPDGRRVLVVANAVDASALDMANPVTATGPVRFGLISSNVAKKGLEDLVRLARACAAAGLSDAAFVVVGPETETVKALKAGQAAGEVPASITFAGYAEGPAEALAGVQVVLNLSRFAESFGRTVAEAMAARRPVIAYRWGALPELVDDGVTGFLVPYGEAEAAVAAVAALLADRSLIGRMGEAGRASVTARYDKPAYRASMEAAYREILATPPHGGGGGPGGGPGNGASDGGSGGVRLGAQAVAPAITAEALAVPLPQAGEGAVVLPARQRPGTATMTDGTRSDAAPASDVPSAASSEPEAPTADCPLPTAGSRSDPPPRIAYFLWHFPVPSETFVLNELRHLVEAGYDVKVWCRQSPHRDFVPDFPIEWERVATPEAFAERLVATGRTAVHAHFTYPTVTDMVWPACEIAGVPFTFIAHSQDIFRHENDAKNRVGEIGRSAFCRKVFVPARFHRAYLAQRGVPEGKLAINPNGVDVDAYAAARRDDRAGTTKRIVAVHRFTEKKGLEPLIAAMALLQRRAEVGDAAAAGITLDLYGYGELEERFAALIAQGTGNGTGDGPLTNVRLAGPVKGRDALVDVLRDADLFACPSVRAADGDMDGIPTVVLEAMAAGLPVLATEIGGLGELVVDGLTGVTVPAAEPDALADAILRYFALPPEQVAAMGRTGIATVSERYRIDRLMRVLTRTWENRGVDLVIVAWNNPAELVEVIDRLYRFTASPFHLIVVDNLSGDDTRRILVAEQLRRPSMTLVLNDENAFVGPGTNRAMAEGSSDVVIYVCGKEGFALAPGWELPFVHALAEDPSVGLAGTLCHAPSYLTGKDYPTGVRLFDQFRNPAFAAENPDRPFEHVQGGLFAIRRAMVEAIGGYSDAVAHDYTDVEFSYYAESCGWRLAEVPGILSLYRKTRPGLMERIDERILAAHPPTLADLPALDAIAQGHARHCNLCGWTGPAFLAEGAGHSGHGHGGELNGGRGHGTAPAAGTREAQASGRAASITTGHAAPFHARCPGCGSSPADRAVYAVLAASPWLNRRLPALVAGAGTKLAETLARAFQGPQMTAEELRETLATGRRLPLKDASRQLILAMDTRTGDGARSAAPGHAGGPSRADAAVLAELARLAAHGAPILLHDTTLPPLDGATATAAGLQPLAPPQAAPTAPSNALQTHHNPVTLWVRGGEGA
ncbi:glycosyltransferase [Pseudoxanthobacter sp. M-2]|uniref:glycosyltransferase n=1 Tax=Pseudoxanthobacter sp. M-2 TaxID=3078754 RepID=UPI0038FCB503